MFDLYAIVRLSPQGETIVDATAAEYGAGYIAEIAKATGVPCEGTIYRVRWYSWARIVRCTIFRENELQPATISPALVTLPRQKTDAYRSPEGYDA
jgi:uncharacterized protein YodC (DUF2158 family)